MIAENTNQLEATGKKVPVNYLLAASVFFLPTIQLASLICWAILFVIAITDKGFASGLLFLKRSFFYKSLIVLYLFYFIGMLWTEHYPLGWEDLQIKIPLLLFPLLFSILKINTDSFKLVRKGLVYGCFLSIVLCFFLALRNYLSDHDIHDFYYIAFSHFMHPTYFTMFINLAVLLLLQGWLTGEETGIGGKIANTLFLLIFISAIVLLSARLAMIASFLTIGFFLLIEAFRLRKLKKLIPFYLLGVLLVGGIFYSLVQMNNRFVQISDVIQHKEDKTALVDSTNHVGYNSTTIRIGLLKNSWSILRENFWFGVGTGDVLPESIKRLNDQGLHVLAEKSNGAHNQYLQTAVTLGIFAALLLLLTLVIPLFHYLRTEHYLFAAFMIIVLINGVGDTILRASSLYFFSFFGCYFYKLFKTDQE